MNILLLACVVYAGTIDEYRVSSLTLTFQPFFKNTFRNYLWLRQVKLNCESEHLSIDNSLREQMCAAVYGHLTNTDGSYLAGGNYMGVLYG